MPETDTGEEWIDDLVADLGAAILQFCLEITEDEKFRLSRPARNDRAPGSPRRGTYEGLESSLPGEPPRRRTGKLQSSVTADVDFEGDDIKGSISTDVSYAAILVEKNRLIITDRIDNGTLADDFADHITDTI